MEMYLTVLMLLCVVYFGFDLFILSLYSMVLLVI